MHEEKLKIQCILTTVKVVILIYMSFREANDRLLIFKEI